jgi:hypothetical protein
MRNALIAILILASSALFAQSQKAKRKSVLPSSNVEMSPSKNLRKGLSATTKFLSIGNAAISMPPALLNGTFHPMVEVGFTKPFRKNATKQRLTVGADAGYFNQKGLQSGFYLKPNIALNIPVYKSFSIAPKLGAGLLLTKNANEEFKLQTNGTYKQIGNVNPQFMATLGVQPTLTVMNSNKYKYSVFMSYEFAAQTPFSAISSLLPMTMVRLGLKVQPRSNKAK